MTEITGMNTCPLVWVIIGVSGSGKTAIGRLLSQRLECDFLEGDRRHPQANVLKMQAHMPLTDDDREQWLLAIAADIHHAIAHTRETVITCSALKVAYRKRLMISDQVQLVWLNVPTPELERRLTGRSRHYMKSDLLRSQLDAFEPPRPEEHAIVLNGVLSPHQIVDNLLDRTAQFCPEIKAEWWRRYRS